MENELEKNTETKKDPVDVSALEARIKELETERDKLKQSVTNASADASKWKKFGQEKDELLKAKMTEEERTKAEQDEANAALQKELADLRAERNVANHKAKLISLGFGDDVATETAQALNAGETDKVFDALRKFIDTHDKQLKENAFRTNPTLPGGNSTKTITREQFDKMGYTERAEVFEKYPDLYKELTS